MFLKGKFVTEFNSNYNFIHGIVWHLKFISRSCDFTFYRFFFSLHDIVFIVLQQCITIFTTCTFS